MQPSLANGVSATLPPERTGIGMGIYSLNNFLSTAVCGAVVTTALERFGSVPANPFAVGGDSGAYSNVCFALFLLTLLNMVFRFKFVRNRNLLNAGD